MKALTIKNPWPILIALGIKDIENRSKRTNYRGRIAIHTSAKSTDLNVMSLLDQRDLLMSISHDLYMRILCHPGWESAIIGEVDIIDCVKNHPSVWADKTALGEKDIWNWVLANPVLYDQPILNVKGAQSFWNYPGIGVTPVKSIVEQTFTNFK